MQFEDIVKAFKSGNISGNYIFYGEEPFFINYLTDLFIEHAISDQERAFGQSIYYGKEANPSIIRDQCLTVPMSFGGNPKQLIVIKEATPIEKNLKPLYKYMEKPVESTILLIVFNGMKALPKSIPVKFATIYKSEPVKEKDMSKWIQAQFKSHGYSIQSDAIQTIIDYAGTNLEQINNEIAKLIIAHPKEKPITNLEIKTNFGIMRDYSVYDLQYALGEKNGIKIFKIVDYFSRNPKNMEDVLLIGSLFNFYKQLYQLKLCQRMKMSIEETVEAMGMNSKDSWKVNSNLKYITNYTIIQLENALIYLAETDQRMKGIKGSALTYQEMIKELTLKLIA